MLVVRATQKLLRRVKGPMAPDWAETTGVLGEWHATALFWKPQVALLVNTRTLIPVFLPLSPAKLLWTRLSDGIEVVLRAHGVPHDTVRDYCGDLDPLGYVPTTEPHVVGVMDDYARRAPSLYDGDLTTLSVRLAHTPIPMLGEGGGYPHQALAEIFGHTPIAPPDIAPPDIAPPDIAPPDIAPRLHPASTPARESGRRAAPESDSPAEPERLAKVIPFPTHRRT